MIYMVLRYRISPITYRQGISYDERRRFIVTFLDKTIERCFHIIHINSSNKSLLSFWLSNCSELLHIISADKEISSCIGETAISKLKTTVEKCYDLLVETTRVALQQPMSTFLKVDLNDEIAAEGVIRQLDDLVQIIRKCHLNAALTIQLFSQLFYFISMYGFNWLVTTREGAFYLSRQFGLHLRTRLQYICHWAEKQGLELAAECHLDRLQQTVNLLTTPKTIDQIASLGATCYKLNSLQVKYLLENYVPEVGEPRASRDLIMEVSRLAESQADVMSKQDGFPIQLEENPQLHLSFVFPSDGYFVEDFKGIPPEMSDFIASLQAKGICRLIPQIGATGSWTIHMNKSNGYSMDQHSSTIGSSNGSNSYPPYSSSNNNNNNNNGYPTSSQASTIRASPPSQQIFLKRLPGDSIGLSIVAAQVCDK
uniref:Dilute domain-containing protein n=1 Tax=Panagrolaimus superbus TaxID=310955 RepID=A0A914Y3H7_9BILA